MAGYFQLDKGFGNYWKTTAAQRALLLGPGDKDKDGKRTPKVKKPRPRVSMDKMREMTAERLKRLPKEPENGASG